MLILTTKSCAIENLTLNNPETSDGVMYCEISQENSPIYIQTPKMFFRETTDGIRILFDNEKKTESVNILYGMIRDIENNICKSLSQNSINWFSESLSLDIISDNLFKTSIKLPDRISEPLSLIVDVPTLDGSKDIEIFDMSRNPREYSELFDENIKESTFLIHAKDLKITSSQASISWEIVQVLIHKKKKKIKGFGIRVEGDDIEKIPIGIISQKEELVVENEINDEDSVDVLYEESIPKEE